MIDNVAFTYRGDGNLAVIGLCETASAAASGENISLSTMPSAA